MAVITIYCNPGNANHIYKQLDTVRDTAMSMYGTDEIAVKIRPNVPEDQALVVYQGGVAA